MKAVRGNVDTLYIDCVSTKLYYFKYYFRASLCYGFDSVKIICHFVSIGHSCCYCNNQQVFDFCLRRAPDCYSLELTDALTLTFLVTFFLIFSNFTLKKKICLHFFPIFLTGVFKQR